MKIRFSKLLSVVLIILFVGLPCSRPSFAFSIGEERELGEKLLYSVRSTFPLLEDPDLVQYINKLGDEVLAVAGLQYFNYHFFLIKDDEFNAFAAPSGLIFFYSGLINSMNSEDELVSVLAHEIGHVAKRHLAGRVEKGKIIGAASLAVALAALALGGGAATQALLTSSLAAGQSANLHYSRKHEEEADLMAYGWLKTLKRDPHGQKTMLETMRRVSRYRSDRLPQYLLTHPNPEFRLDYIDTLLKIDENELTTHTIRDEFEFLRFKYRIMAETMDAMVFREHLISVLSDSRSTAFSKIMAKYGLSQLERHANNYSRGKKLIEEVVEALPDKNLLLTDQGILHFEAGEYVDARILLEKGYNHNVTDMYSAFYLGKTYKALGDLKKAENLFKSVSYQMPEYSKVYFELGSIASQQNQEMLSSLNLGKFYLYEGKIKLAKFSLNNVVKGKTTTESMKIEAERFLETIEKLEEK